MVDVIRQSRSRRVQASIHGPPRRMLALEHDGAQARHPGRSRSLARRLRRACPRTWPSSEPTTGPVFWMSETNAIVESVCRLRGDHFLPFFLAAGFLAPFLAAGFLAAGFLAAGFLALAAFLGAAFFAVFLRFDPPTWRSLRAMSPSPSR